MQYKLLYVNMFIYKIFKALQNNKCIKRIKLGMKYKTILFRKE